MNGICCNWQIFAQTFTRGHVSLSLSLFPVICVHPCYNVTFVTFFTFVTFGAFHLFLDFIKIFNFVTFVTVLTFAFSFWWRAPRRPFRGPKRPKGKDSGFLGPFWPPRWPWDGRDGSTGTQNTSTQCAWVVRIHIMCLGPLRDLYGTPGAPKRGRFGLERPFMGPWRSARPMVRSVF